MSVSIMTPSGLRSIQRFRVMHFGELRTVRTLKVMDNGNLRLVGNFYPDISVTPNPASVSGSTFGTIATTGPVTLNVSGGSPPFTYQWTLVSFTTPVAPTALDPTSATTAFRGRVAGRAVFKYVVTDSLGSSAEGTVNANFVSID